MKSAVKRALWQRTLESAGPLRQPLPAQARPDDTVRVPVRLTRTDAAGVRTVEHRTVTMTRAEHGELLRTGATPAQMQTLAAHFNEPPLQARVKVQRPDPAPRYVVLDGGCGDDMTGVMLVGQPPTLSRSPKLSRKVSWSDLADAFALALYAKGGSVGASTTEEFAREHLGKPYPWQRQMMQRMALTPPERLVVMCPRQQQKAALRRLEDTMLRQSVRTTRQMLDAPIGAAFLWGHDRLQYPRDLARHLGRTDLRIVGPSWLQHGWRGQRLPALVVDHATWWRLTRIQRDMLDNAIDYLGSRPPPVVSWPRRAGKATALQALEAAQRERWCRDLDREIRQPASWNADDLEGSSCD